MRARIALAVLAAAAGSVSAADADLSGELKLWHRVTLTFDGPATAEDATPNPFTDYRLTVTFRHGDRAVVVPGFYAADGDPGQTGAAEGGAWRVRFLPDATGEWAWSASFRTGKGVATAAADDAGKPTAFDGARGRFTIAPTDKTGRDFRGRGLLRHVGRRYLRFAGSGEYFIKGGADSPENLLGYADFDGTFDTGGRKRRKGESQGKGLHRYQPHVKDWRRGDPTWRGGKGKGLIGALNYLASTGMNSVYFIPFNIAGGDGKDTWPWTAPDERLRFDCSKLAQWEIVFSHMDRLGLMLHPITQEQENDQALDGGDLGPQRKLYYRELIARFAHHPAITWNLGEENTNSDAQRKAFCTYIRGLDPYDHPIVCHTFPGRYDRVYGPLLGFEAFEGPSLQMGNMRATHRETLKWVLRSAGADRRWFVSLDEIGPASTGVKPDKDDPDHDDVRRYALWGNMMAGGAGCEWYFGYRYAHNDLNCEDWRSRAAMWAQTRHALEFFHAHLPFWAMKPADDATARDDDYCLALPGKLYAVYMPDGKGAGIDLPDGRYTVGWYDPRNGGDLAAGPVKELPGGGRRQTGEAPTDAGKDWVVLLRARGDWEVGPDAAPPAYTAEELSAAGTPGSGGGRRREPKRTGKPPRITGFALVDAGKNRVIEAFDPLADGATIDLAKLPTRTLSIVARTTGDVDEVTLTLDGKHRQSERTPPYALAGDTNGDYDPAPLAAGKHTLTATARGAGKTHKVTIRFTLAGK